MAVFAVRCWTVKDDIVVLKVQPDGVKLEFVKSAIAAVTTDEQAA